MNLEPTEGSETGRARPSIVVTNNFYNQRVPVIQVAPITGWTEKKAKIVPNVVIQPTNFNGLTKKSVADCLQTRPIDYRKRVVAVQGKGKLSDTKMKELIEP